MHARLPASLSSCYTFHQPTRASSFGLFLRVRPFPPVSSLGTINALLSTTDNSIILHAKTASDVLAQSASHLCEQITSYRKTDFIFEKERWS